MFWTKLKTKIKKFIKECKEFEVYHKKHDRRNEK